MNKQQKAAADAPNGYTQIIAGPGTGKTVTMIGRIVELKRRGIDPSRIVAMTFTRASAQELKERLIKELGTSATSIQVGTFHSVAINLMRRYGEMRRLNMRVLGDHDALSLCLEITTEISPRRLSNLFEVLKRSRSELERKLECSMQNDGNKPLHITCAQDVEKIFEQYREKQHASGLYDFDEILDLFNKFLERCGTDTVARDVDAVLIDEFQDTNSCQLQIAMRMTALCHNLTVVGDPKQCIYAFRGASPQIFEAMNEYSDVKICQMPLTVNYRSTQPILDFAQNVITPQYSDKHRGKTLSNVLHIGNRSKAVDTSPEIALPVQIIKSRNDQSEAALITTHVRQLLDAGVRANDICLLSSTSKVFSNLESTFVAKNIRYRVVGGKQSLNCNKFASIIDYLRVALNSEDSLAIKRSINVPPRQIGKKAIDSLVRDCSSDLGLSMKKLKNKVEMKGVMTYVRIIEKSHEILMRPTEGLENSDAQVKIGNSDYGFNKQNVVSAVTWLHSNLFPNIDCDASVKTIDVMHDEFCSITESEISPESNFASYFVSLWALEPDTAENLDEATATVTCSTIHSAKGLEWPIVFLLGVDRNNYWKSNNTVDSSHDGDDDEGMKDLDELRRSIFVAVTRAKRYLTIVFSNMENSDILNLNSRCRSSISFRPVNGALLNALQPCSNYPLKQSSIVSTEDNVFVGFRSGLELYNEEKENLLAKKRLHGGLTSTPIIEKASRPKKPCRPQGTLDRFLSR